MARTGNSIDRAKRKIGRRTITGRYQVDSYVTKYDKRECICCEKEFMSWGAANRLCPECREKNDQFVEYRTADGNYWKGKGSW